MLEIRTLTDADLPALSRRLQAEYPRERLDPTNLRNKIHDDPAAGTDRTLLAWRGDHLAGALIGARQDALAYVKIMTCGPDVAASDALLTEFEARQAAAGAAVLKVSGSAPNYFLPGVDPTDTETLGFYLSRGFQKEREAYNMVCDLTRLATDTAADEAALAADGITLARLRPADDAALTEFMTAHFSPGWLAETRLALAYDPVPCHLAWHGGRIIAFAAMECTNPGWFGPMGTDRAWRGRGLGRITLLRCLADARAMGYRTAQIGWVGPLGFYARHCGAVVDRTFWMLSRPIPAG